VLVGVQTADRGTRTAHVDRGRRDDDVMSGFRHATRQRVEPGGADAVVVGEEHSHP
jgi:hypothetical protein